MSSNLNRLNPTEQQVILEFVQSLEAQFSELVRVVLLFGSKARGDSTPDSDLDVLVVVDSDDWRVHKQIRYLAADVCLKYGLNVSPRVWSTSHLREMEDLRPLLYQNIRRDSINLLDLLPAIGS